jgi:hypothetical protein
MAKISRRPFFAPVSRKPREYETLVERDDCIVDKLNGVVRMETMKPWCEQHAALAREHKVAHLALMAASFGNHESAHFLLEVPWLTGLTIDVYSAKDLAAVGRLEQLESLRLRYGVWRLGDRFVPVDFSRLTQLRHVDVMMCPAFESILACKTIQALAVSNDCDRKLRDLDLSRLGKLRDLQLDHCPKLRRVTLHPGARLRALSLSLCGSYEPDWDRFGPELRILVLGGRINFPLENILKASKLEELQCLEIRKLPPLGFLRQLAKLHSVVLFAAPPGPILSDEDRASVSEVNARAKRRRKL